MTTATDGPPSPPARHTLRCRTVAEGVSRHRNHIRDLAPFAVGERFGVSEDPEMASPPEALLAAQRPCLVTRIHANAAAGSIRVASLELHIEVDVGPSALWSPPGIMPAAVGFETIRIAVQAPK